VIEKNLVLYIHVNIDGIPIKKYLIDTSSNVNVCSIDLLQKHFPSTYTKMKIITISIKEFDNTKKECVRYVFMLIEVGGKMVHQNLYVFKVNLPYNLLLG